MRSINRDHNVYSIARRPIWLLSVVVCFLITLISWGHVSGSLSSEAPPRNGPQDNGAKMQDRFEDERHSDVVVIFSARDVQSGERLEYRASVKRLQMTKPWSPEREPPPLTIAAAVQTAKKASKPRKPEDLDVLRIELGVVDAAGQYRWYYVVRLYDTTEAHADRPPAASSVLVLMDGSVVTPISVK